MGIRVFDFVCPDGHRNEEFVGADYREGDVVPCSEMVPGFVWACGQPAVRQIAAPRAKLEGLTGAFPGAADKWARDRDSHMARERKNKQEHGTYK